MDGEQRRKEWHRSTKKATHVFARDLPSRLLLVQLISDRIARQPNNDITLDSPQTSNTRRSSKFRHRTNRVFERRRRRCSAIVRQLAVVQIALEDDEVAAAQMQEQIRRFSSEVPESVAGAPEGMLLVDPLAGALVALPALTESVKGLHLLIGREREELPVDARVDEPGPIVPGHIADEPRETFAVEVNLADFAGLNEVVGYKMNERALSLLKGGSYRRPHTVDHIAVKLEPGVIENEIETTTLECADDFPDFVDVVPENVLFRGSESLATSGLQFLDVGFGHLEKIPRCTWLD